MAKCKTCDGFMNPYTKSDYRSLKEAQRRITELLPTLDRLENCGQECDIFRQVANELMERLTDLEREFMSPVPKS